MTRGAFLLMLCVTTAAAFAAAVVVAHETNIEQQLSSSLSTLVATNSFGSDVLHIFRCALEVIETPIKLIAWAIHCTQDLVITSTIKWKLTVREECCHYVRIMNSKCFGDKYPFNLYEPQAIKDCCNALKHNHKATISSTIDGVDPANSLAPAVITAPSSAMVPLFRTPEIGHCFNTFRSIDGCLEDTVTSFMNGTIQTQIAPSCCKVILEGVQDQCWTDVFPVESYFPRKIRNYCTDLLQGLPVLPSSLTEN